MTRALVLSGGGANGAWQEGVLRYLIEVEPLERLARSVELPYLGEHLEASKESLQPLSHVESLLDCLLDVAGADLVNRLRRPYDTICGVSVGALNGSVLAEPRGVTYSIFESYRKLSEIWDGVCPKRIRKRWFLFGQLAALWKPAMWNSRPLWDLIRSNLSVPQIASSPVQLRIGAVSLTSGKYHGFTEKDPNIVEGVIASSAYPIYFLPVQIGDELWTDGGARDIAPLGDAIKAGATEIDVVVCQPLDPGEWHGKDKTLDLAGRTLTLMTTEIVINDIRACQRVNEAVREGRGKPHHREVKLRIFAPEKSVGSGLDFSPEKVARLRQQGYEDAQAIAASLAS